MEAIALYLFGDRRNGLDGRDRRSEDAKMAPVVDALFYLVAIVVLGCAPAAVAFREVRVLDFPNGRGIGWLFSGSLVALPAVIVLAVMAGHEVFAGTGFFIGLMWAGSRRG